MLRFYVASVTFLLLVIVCLITESYEIALVVLISYVFFVIIGVTRISSGVFTKASCRINTSEPIVGISFDDGPDKNTPEILTILKEHNIKASFFCIGSKMEENPELSKKIFDEGHLLANHSYSHSNSFPFKSVKKISQELDDTQRIIFEITGTQNTFFRPPFGVLNPRIAKAINKHKLTIVGWSIRSFDTSIKNKEKVLKRITKRLKKGDIILLHDTSADIIWILKELIQVMKQKGLTGVRIDRDLL